MNVLIEEDLCTNCLLCADLCSEVFITDQNGKIKVVPFDETAEIIDACNEAAEMCPTEAIIII